MDDADSVPTPVDAAINTDSTDLGVKKRGKTGLVILLVVGLSMTVLSMTIYALFPSILRCLVASKTAITGPDSLLYKGWVNPASDGVPLYRSFTWMNVSNPVQVVQGLETPNLVPVGPYVYIENRVKDESSIHFSPEDGTVKYKYSTTFTFNVAKSKDRLSGRQLDDKADVLSMANFVLFGSMHRLTNLPPVVRQFGKFTFSKAFCCYVLDWAISSGFLGPADLGPAGIFVNRTVHELLFGYDDTIATLVHPVLKMLKYVASKRVVTVFNGTNPVPSAYTYRSGQRCPLWTNESQCNSSSNQYTTEGMGVQPSLMKAANADLGGQINSAGNITKWAGQNSLWWMGSPRDGYDAGYGLDPVPNAGLAKANNSDDCSFLEGSDGLRFPPFLKKGSKISVFLDLAWRKFRFVNTRPSVVKGIDSLHYELDPIELSNTDPHNVKCNSVHEYGMFNASNAVFGPALITKAYFLDTKFSPKQLNFTLSTKIGGHRYTTVSDFLKAAYSQDAAEVRAALDLHVDIHPMTGVSLKGTANAFVSLPFGPLKVVGCNGVGTNTSLFTTAKNLPQGMYLPLAMIERTAVIPDRYAAKLRLFDTVIEMVPPLLLAFALVGALIAFLGPVRQMVLARKDRKAREGEAEKRRLESSFLDPNAEVTSSSYDATRKAYQAPPTISSTGTSPQKLSKGEQRRSDVDSEVFQSSNAFVSAGNLVTEPRSREISETRR